ncbi:MAG: bacteriophage abortive infection AbiH family protein [Lachnospiraceae bacterium]|nr:bacteriophage abortive infection AbiH family protein [Lachnospiraceae bacterium]
MRRLIIVGNGFDLHHGMKTNYIDYRDYLLSHGRQDIVGCFEYGDEDDLDKSFLWSRMEEILGMVNYESAYRYLRPVAEEKPDSSNHDFKNEVEKMTRFWPDIKMELPKWIRHIQYTEKDASLDFLMEEDTIFLSFNYTNTLEILYGIDKARITYIHGDASVSDELVLGHRNDSYYPEWDDEDLNCDIRLREAGLIMEKHRKNTIKRIEDILQNNQKFFSCIEELEEVYVIGLSYNDIDRMYLEKIHSIKKGLRWFFNWHTKWDFQRIDSYAKSIGINEYNKINIANGIV